MMYIVISGALSAIIAAVATHLYYIRGTMNMSKIKQNDGTTLVEIEIWRAHVVYRYVLLDENDTVLYVGDAQIHRKDAYDNLYNYVRKYGDKR